LYKAETAFIITPAARPANGRILLRTTLLEVPVNSKTIPILVAGVLFASASHADTVVTSNGDALHGQIKQMKDGELEIGTPYADVKLPWEQVRSASTDGSMVVTLTDGSKLIGTLSTTPSGKLSIQPQTAEAPVAFPISAVTKLWPGDTPEPMLKVNGYVNIGVKATEGNTNTKSYHGDGEFVARTPKNRYTIGAELNYAEDNGQTTANDKRAYARYDYFLTQKWYVNTNMSFLKDEFQNLNLRSTLGAGMGYQFIETDDTKLGAELGGSYIREDYSDDLQDDSSIAARWALDYSQTFFDNAFTLFHHDELLKGVAADNDLFLAYTRQGIRFPLGSGLAGTVQVNYDYNGNPQGDNAYYDTTYLMTVGYTF